jgi:hypothetical protein
MELDQSDEVGWESTGEKHQLPLLMKAAAHQ